MVKSLYLLVFCWLLSIVSCQNCDSTNKTDRESSKQKLDSIPAIQEEKKYLKPNDEFRDKVLSLEPSKKGWLDTLLLNLDERGLSFCDFMKQLFILDDSCYAEAKKSYPDPVSQSEFANMHDRLIKVAESKYYKTLKISSRLGNLAGWEYGFSEKIKNFCGRF